MPAKLKRVTVHGGKRDPVLGARAVGAVPDDERFEVTIRLRPKSPLDPLAKVNADVLPKDRHYLSRQEYAKGHGADPEDIKKVTAFAQSNGLVVVEASPDRRSMVLSGTAAAFSAAFEVKLTQFEYDQGTFRGRSGELTIPADLEGVIEGVFGLDDRPQARPHYQSQPITSAKPMAARAGSFTPPQLAKLYNFPTGLDGKGECIAIIELGGGYRTTDLKTYFKSLGLAAPKVKTVRVDGVRNHPSTPDGADGEVMLDIEVAAAIAPKSLIVVYFAPNTDKGFLDAVTQALHDKTNKPSVISISWGGPEASWTSQAMAQYDQAFQTAAALGVTICVAAGDSGSSDGETDGAVHVDFPASSPNVLGCGGTELVATGAAITRETVWNENANSATGGGISSIFPLPAYQKNVPVPTLSGPGTIAFRGVPDVAGDADPNTGYQVRVDGQDMVIGGTSAVAPLWAGLIALINQKLGTPAGFLNPLLYGSLSGKNLFNDVTSGNNGAYSAGPGWDACTGWGSPDGSKLLAALGG